MKKKFGIIKRIAASILAVILLLTLASCGGTSVETTSGSHGSLNWSYDTSNKILTISGAGPMEDFANADSVAWKEIRTLVQTVKVGEDVESIGNYAFYGMSALTSVELSDADGAEDPHVLTRVGDLSFAYCQKLTGINLPSTLVEVGRSAFEGCAALTSVYLQANVTKLGDSAFAYCHAMTNVIVTGEVERVGANTFKNCRSLESLVFRTTMTADRIDESAFTGASKSFADATLTDNATGATAVTVTYVYEDGSEAAPTYSNSWNFGQNYTVSSPTIEGYTPDVETVAGTANGQAHQVTVTYKQAQTSADGNAETEAPAEQEPEGVTPMTIVFIVIMVLIIIAIAVAAFFMIRSDKKNAGKNTTTVVKNRDGKNEKNEKNAKKGKKSGK